jgi:hypothetical protein
MEPSGGVDDGDPGAHARLRLLALLQVVNLSSSSNGGSGICVPGPAVEVDSMLLFAEIHEGGRREVIMSK